MIVVDNSSSDTTRGIAEKVGCLVLEAGPERSAQRNRGADSSRGAYLLFVDSDMVLEATVVEECLAVARSGADAAIIPETSFGEGFWAGCKRLERSCYVGDDEIEAARFYARDLFLRIGGFDEQLTAGEDWDLHERAKAEGARIGRVKSFIHHDEGRLTLSQLAIKKFQYGKSLPLYRKKHRAAADRQFRLIRPAFVRNRRTLAAEPLALTGLIIMKSIEFAAGAAGALVALGADRRKRATSSPK